MPEDPAPETPQAAAPPRTQEIIQTEYEALAKAVGDKDYRIAVLKSEKQPLQQKMFQLNQEMNALTAKAGADPQGAHA